MAVDQIILELRAEAKQFKAELAQVKSQVEATEKRTLLAQNNMNKGFNQMSGSLKNLAGTIGLAFGVNEVLRFTKATIDAASNIQETTTKVGELFGASQREVLEWSKTTAQSIGQSQQQALDAASTFAIFGKSAGLSGDSLVKFSTDFTSLASDLASFNNTSPEEAIQAIGAALRGEAEPIRRYGVLLDEASIKQSAMRLGIIKTTKEALTPQQKVLAVQAEIYRQTTAAQGDFARTSDGLANQQRILSAEFENLKTELGQEFLPIVLDVTKVMVDFLKEIDTKDIKDFLNVIKSVGAALVTYLTVTKGISLAQKAATLAQAAYRAVTLASAGAQALLAGNTMRAAAAQRALGVASMATPWGMIAALIAGAATALALFGDNTEDAANEQNELKKKLDESNKAVEEHWNRLDLVNDTWAKYKQNKSALSVEEIRKAIEALNTELENASEVGQREVDLQRSRAFVIDEVTGKLVENKNAETVYKETQEEANKRQLEYIKGLKSQRDAFIALLQTKQQNISSDKEQLGAYEKLTKRVSELNKQLLDNITLNKDTYKQERELIKLKKQIEEIQFEANALLSEGIALKGIATGVDKEYVEGLIQQRDAWEGLDKKMAETLGRLQLAEADPPGGWLRRLALDLENTVQLGGALGDLMKSTYELSVALGAESAEFQKGLALFNVQLALAESIAGIIKAISLNAKDPFTIATGIISGIAAVTSAIAQSVSIINSEQVPQPPAFAEGTAYVGLNGNPKGIDTIPAYLNEGEAVIPTDRNKKYPGLASAWINNKLDDYIMSNWVAPAIEQERNRNFADNLAEAIKVSGVFDDYRLYRSMEKNSTINKAGFNELAKALNRNNKKRGGYA